MRRGMIVLLFGVVVIAPLFAVPINYHAKITDNLGIGLTDTTLTVELQVWDAVIGGSLLAADTQDVVVTKGLFSAQFDLDLPSFDWVYSPLYYQIVVDGVAFSPRQRIGAVMWSYWSDFSETTAAAVAADVHYFPPSYLVSGNVQDALAELTDTVRNWTLQDAYWAADTTGDSIKINSGKPVRFLGDEGDGQVFSVRGDVIDQPLVEFRNDTAGGTGLYIVGHLWIGDGSKFYSDTDLRFDLDEDIDATDHIFEVYNDTDATVFSVDEHGVAKVMSELYVPYLECTTGVVTHNADIYDTATTWGVFRADTIYNPWNDTLWIGDHDRLWADKVITDSIATRGDTVFIGDHDRFWADQVLTDSVLNRDG
ncbi:MAG TPA: hypothetical protein ENG11_02635, partial [candidate division Zixibacteria bacterium]|nr:hypothetical protein [candidate division Zixibacteria bacterium]